MSKAFIYAANTTQQTLTGGGSVDLGSAIHGFGCTCCNKTIDINGNNITLREGGYYEIIISSTVTGSAAGTVTLTLYQDGTPITGATTAVNIAAANEVASASIACGVLVNRCSSSIITLVATTTAGDVIISNVSTTIDKI